MTDGIQSAVQSVSHVVKELRPVGIATVMWTTVLCFAVIHLPQATLEKLWPQLYLTWIGLVVAHAVLAAGVAVWERPLKRKSKPEIATTPAQKVEPSA